MLIYGIYSGSNGAAGHSRTGRVQDDVGQSANGNSDCAPEGAHFVSYRRWFSWRCDRRLRSLSNLFVFFVPVPRCPSARCWSSATARPVRAAPGASARTSWGTVLTSSGRATGTGWTSPETCRSGTRWRARRSPENCAASWATAPCPRGGTGTWPARRYGVRGVTNTRSDITREQKSLQSVTTEVEEVLITYTEVKRWS